MRAMILAAGLGERLRPLTEKTPKPLLTVNGKPLIQYHLERLAAAGVREIVINTSWLGDQIEAFVGDGSRFGVRILWSRESEPLETGGGVRRALPLLGNDPFLLVNGDVWTDYPFKNLMNREWPENMDAHLVMVPNPVYHGDGDFCLDENNTVRYPERESCTFTFSGISVMRPEIFALYPSASECFAIRDVLASGIKAGCVSGESFRGTWWDVGTLDRYQALNRLMQGKALDRQDKPKVRAG